MALTVLSTAPHIVGGNFSAQCQASVSHHVNTPVSIEFIWTKGAEQLSNSLADSRVEISETAAVSSHVYRSILTINDLSIGAHSNENFSCQASVRPIPISQYIRNSTTASSSSLLLEVQGMPLSLSLTLPLSSRPNSHLLKLSL